MSAARHPTATRTAQLILLQVAAALFFTIRPALVGAQGSEWEGDYGPPGAVPQSRWQSQLSVNCPNKQCIFSYSYNGHHACGYQGQLSIVGNVGTHHARIFEPSQDSPSEQNDAAEEDTDCDVEIQFSAVGLQRLANITKVSGACSYECGASARFDGGLFEKFRSRPSFNCERARTGVEQALCSSIPLGERDTHMARLFADIKRMSPGSTALTQQRAWLQSRDTCLKQPSTTVACLQTVYDARIAVLTDVRQYLRVVQLVAAPGIPSPWQAAGLDQIAAPKAELESDGVTPYLNEMVSRDWLIRATAGALSTQLEAPDDSCYHMDASSVENGVELLKIDCFEQGGFLLEASRSGELWIAYRFENGYRWGTFEAQPLSTAPAELQQWLDERVNPPANSRTNQPPTLTADALLWPTQEVFKKGCFFAGRTFEEWAAHFQTIEQADLANDAESRWQHCMAQ